jgi:hypothetical protein
MEEQAGGDGELVDAQKRGLRRTTWRVAILAISTVRQSGQAGGMLMVRSCSRAGVWQDPDAGKLAANTGRIALLANVGFAALALGLGGAGCASTAPDAPDDPAEACEAADGSAACERTTVAASLGTLTPGSNLLGHLAAGGRDEYAFTVNQGEGVFFRLVDVAGGTLAPGFTVYGPSGTAVTSASSANVASASFAAGATGTYTIAVFDTSSGHVAGDYRLYFTRAPGANAGGALSPGGAITAHLDEGAIDSYTFTAGQGESVFLRVVDLDNAAMVPAFTIYGPAGGVVANALGGSVASFSFAAATAGTYTVVVYDWSSGFLGTGDYKLYFTRSPGANAGGALSPGGAITAHLDEGAIDSYTFIAGQGESVFLRLVDLDNAAMVPAFTIYGPAGGVVANALGGSVASFSFAAAVAGTYTVVVYDWSSGFLGTGDYKLYFTRSPGANAGGLLAPGSVTLGHLDEGEIDSYTFTANQGEGVFLRLVDVAGGTLVPAFAVYGPTGTAVTSASSANVASASFAAGASGTYTVVVYDLSTGLTSTGDYRLYFTRAPGANAGGALSPGGAVTAHLDEGAIDSYTFTAGQGESVFLRLVDLDNAAMVPAFTIYGPTGGVVANALGGSVASFSFAAAAAGTYTVVVYDWSSGFLGTGDYKLYFTRSPGANAGGLLAPGSVTLGHLDEGEIDSYTFTANQGEGVFLRLVDAAGGTLVPAFAVYGPTGTAVTSASSANVASASFAAGASGTYTVVVYDLSTGLTSTGDYRLYFTRAPGANAGGALAPGGAAFGHLDEGAIDSYTFFAIASDRVTLQVTDLAAGPLVPAFTVYGPAGGVVVNALGADVASKSFAVAATGVYTVVVYDWSSGFVGTGDYELDFTRTPGP